MEKIFQKEKGVSMALAVLILSILLTIALGISNFVSRQIKMIREVGYSVKAFYAADSGIEISLLTSTTTQGSIDGVSYNVTCQCCPSNIYPQICPNPDCPPNCPLNPRCLAPNYCLFSVGTYQNFSRVIQIEL